MEVLTLHKSFALIATAAALPIMSGTALAANLFSDVPRDHWAYDAVEQLATDGIIEGYGDSTYRGDRAITRYEMAQMTAKAMAKDTNDTHKAILDKLIAEFSEELRQLGVRVAELERNADRVKWEGMLRWRHQSQWQDNGGTSQKRTANYLTLRLEPSMEINRDWSAHARIDYHINTVSDSEVTKNSWAATGKEVIPTSGLKRFWVQYDHKNLHVCLDLYIFGDKQMREHNVNDVVKRVRDIFSDKLYIERLSASDKNWTGENVSTITKSIENFLKLL
jgi:hypothetical protein